MSIDQSNAFPNYSPFDVCHRIVGTNLSDDPLPPQEQTRYRTTKTTAHSTGKAASGSSRVEDTVKHDERYNKRRNGVLKIAGISVGSIATAAGVTHMNEVLTLAKDWGPGTIVIILLFFLLFNLPLQWSKYKNDQEDRSERKELFMAILSMQEHTTNAISGLGSEVRANTGKIDQLIIVLSNRSCLGTPQPHPQPHVDITHQSLHQPIHYHHQYQQPQLHPQSNSASKEVVSEEDNSDHDSAPTTTTTTGPRRKRS